MMLLLPGLFPLTSATVVVSTYCELYSLSRADLEEVLQQWPELAQEFATMGESGQQARWYCLCMTVHGQRCRHHSITNQNVVQPLT
jgi:hypothetical protein